MVETPRALLDLNRRAQEQAPSYGLGFAKATLDPDLQARLVAHYHATVRLFQPETPNDYLRTLNRRFHPSLIWNDEAFNRRLLNDLQAVHEAWSGRALRPAACYGIRVYQPGSHLYSHVDLTRTHIISSTICVDARLNRPWPLYIEDPEGQGHEIEVQPGEMVFYEGARLMHGRPHPLDGESYANIFVHYTPEDTAGDD